MKRFAQVLLITAALTDTASASNECYLEPINVRSTVEKNGTDEIIRGDYLIKLHGANKMGVANKPIWTGGIEVVKADQSICTSPIGIIENPIALAGNKRLYVSTYSGSDQALYVINLDNCGVEWKSASFQSAGTRLYKNTVRLGLKKISINEHCLPDLKSSVVGKEDDPILNPESK